jgi:hypothetical protein
VSCILGTGSKVLLTPHSDALPRTPIGALNTAISRSAAGTGLTGEAPRRRRMSGARPDVRGAAPGAAVRFRRRASVEPLGGEFSHQQRPDGSKPLLLQPRLTARPDAVPTTPASGGGLTVFGQGLHHLLAATYRPPGSQNRTATRTRTASGYLGRTAKVYTKLPKPTG